MRELADRELVQRAQKGDRAAMGELFSRYWRAARAVAFGVTGEFASAEDAASEAFGRVLTGIGTLRDPDRFPQWLRTIVLRKARMEMRSGLILQSGVSEDIRFPDGAVEAELVERELSALIHKATMLLPEASREAIALVYLEGYEPELAARFLCIPDGTLRRRLHDGRAHIRITVERLLKGRYEMSKEQERRKVGVQALIGSGEIFKALQASLALRPPSRELMEELLRTHYGRVESSAAKALAQIVQRLAGSSERASDMGHPVGVMGAAIRTALSDFKEWAPARIDSVGPRQDTALPPGFDQGIPGAFLRGSRALVRATGNEPVQSIYELLQESRSEDRFRDSLADLRLSDVIDITWMTAGGLDLRSVQELLERVALIVAPDAQPHFSKYAEPRYRSALQLRYRDGARGAYGGVLEPWAGFPEGMSAAHARLYLEPLAAVRSGQAIELQPLPHLGD